MVVVEGFPGKIVNRICMVLIKRGVSHMMLPRMIACHEGLIFVAAVGVDTLANYLPNNDNLKNFADSFFGLSTALVSLTLDELYEIGGFAIALQPGQVLEVPGGCLCAETSLSHKAIYLQWVNCRPHPNSLNWQHHLQKTCELVAKDLHSFESGTSPKPGQREMLTKLDLQLKIAPKLLAWMIERLSVSETSAWGLYLEALSHEDMIDMDAILDYYVGDSKFAKFLTSLVVQLNFEQTHPSSNFRY